MDDNEWIATRFEAHRRHLQAVAYRILGSVSEAEDAVQEAWLRLSRADATGVENPGGWFTTIVARVALNMLQSRRARREEPLTGHVPDPVVRLSDADNPEHHALMADSVGLALLVVLDTLTPPERLAFVLHDMFAMPFGEIADILDRSATAARQLASRARRRVQTATIPDPDITRQRKVVNAFMAAARNGDFDALLALLDPHAIMRVDLGPATSRVVSGAATIVKRALVFAGCHERYARLVLVNGAPGILVTSQDRPVAILGFTISGEKIIEIDILADTTRLRQLALPSVVARREAGDRGARG